MQHLVDDGGREVAGVIPRVSVHDKGTRSDHAAAGGRVEERAARAACEIAPVVKLDPAQILANVHTNYREPVPQRALLAVTKINEESLALGFREPARCFVERAADRLRGHRV